MFWNLTEPSLFEMSYATFLWVRNFFFADSASVHTYPVNPAYESAPFWTRSPEWKFLNTLWIRNRVDAKSGSSPVLYREYCIQDGNLDACREVMSLKLSEFKVRPCQNSYHQPVTVQIRFTNPDFEIMISWKTSPASKSYGSSFFTAYSLYLKSHLNICSYHQDQHQNNI